ncbi:hypothetical protein M3Y98_00394600 [Aphelenchoides besseyi]|nr:hypothetical protein M3Y98_00394600 [Aphelenchoides besseyi]
MKGSLKEVINYSFNHRFARNSCSVGRFDESGREKVVAGTSSSKVFRINFPCQRADHRTERVSFEKQ